MSAWRIKKRSPQYRFDAGKSEDPRAIWRRDLYRTDPIWRLTKNKDNCERRQRAKRRG